MTKKVLSLVLAICMVVGLLPAMAVGTAAAEPAGEMTIYFQNNWLWGDVRIYYWGSADSDPVWPGNAMEKAGNDGNYDIYKVTVPAGVTGIIINGIKDDGSGSRDQTPDITEGWYDGICYYMLWDNGNAVGSQNIDVILPPPPAPNVANVRSNVIYRFVCNTPLPAGQDHQAIGVTFDTNYFVAGEPVKNADGKWIVEVTCQVKAMWENHTSGIYEYNYPDYTHTSEALPEALIVTLTWDSEAEEWVFDGENSTFDISCHKTSTEPAYAAEVDGQGFQTLEAAVDYAETVEGSTVKLLKNISLDTDITIEGGKFTIDLNGFVWESSNWALYVQGTADVIITSGVDGGVLRGTKEGSPTVMLLNTAKLEIAGGTVENTGGVHAVDLSLSGNPTEARLLISGGKVTTNGSSAIWAFGSAVTITGGVLESPYYEIDYCDGIIDLSGHTNPTGIGIEIGYNVTEVAVGTDILLPEGYCLIDDSTGEPATTLVTYGIYTVAAAPTTDVAEVDGQGFETLAEAVAYAETVEGSTLKLLQNLSLDTTTIVEGGKFTIDLNGFVWESSNWALYVQGTADVIITSGVDGGVLRGTNRDYPTVQLLNTAKLEISGGTVENSAEGVVINPSDGGHPTEIRLVISGGKVTTNGSSALWAFGSAVTVTGGILESNHTHIDFFNGVVDLSGHTAPAGIKIRIGYTITEAAVGTDILLPAGYCLVDDSTGEPATTLVTYGSYTVAAAPTTPEPATVTGVSFSGNGVTFDAETNTYYVSSDATDITVTITGTNFANLTEEYFVNFAFNGTIVILECYVDVENNIASFTRADASEFFGSDGHELYYFTDGGATWTSLGIYVTYVDSTELTYSVVGSFIEWNPTDPAYIMTLGADGKYTLTKTLAAGTHEFKIIRDHAWEENYGYDGTLENGVTYNLELGGINASFTLDDDADVTFTFDPAAKTVTVSWTAASATPEPATVTGVSLSGNGVTFDAATNTYYISAYATDIVITLTGTNFANLTTDYSIWYAARTSCTIHPSHMTVDTENNTATRSDLIAGEFADSDGFEICYSTDGEATWTGLGVYVTYVENTPDYATKDELEAAAESLRQLIEQLEQTYGIEVPALKATLIDLQQQIADLNDTYATDADVKTLSDELKALAQQVTDLENTYATKTELAAEIARLEQLIADLELAYGGDNAGLVAELATLKSDLAALQAALAALDDTYVNETQLTDAVNAINQSLTDLADRVAALEATYATKTELEAAIAELKQLIADGDAANAQALAEAVAKLEKALADAIAALEQVDADNKAALEQLITDAKAALEAAIAALEARVTQNETDIAALEAALEQAIADLEKAIADGDQANADALAEAVAQLEKALADAIAALEKADADNKAALEKLITDAKAALETALAEAVAKLEQADADNKAALEAMIADLETALRAVTDALDARLTQNEADIAALQAALEQAIEDLKKAIAEGDEANAKALAEAVELLTNALEAAVAKLEAADEKNRTELEALIAEAKATLEAAIARLRNELYVVRGEILTIMNEKNAILEGKLADLAAALEAAVAASQAADEALKGELAQAVTELNGAIDEAKAALETAIEQVAADLDAAHQALTISMAAGDRALHSRIDDLSEALAAAIAAAEAADADLSEALNAAVATLNAAIAQVQKDLDESKAEQALVNAQQDARMDRMNTFNIVVCVIAGLGLAGCAALTVYILVEKRRKA